MKDILNKKKLTDIFLRKQDRKKLKEEVHQKQTEQFDQSFYDCEIMYTQLITSLIKVTAIVNSGSNAGQFLPLNCKWYIKNKFDFKQIQDVKGACFQPCLEDIGNIICVQAQPFIEGKKYTGITIMKQTAPLLLDKKLETLCNQFFIQTKTKFYGKIQAIFSQNSKYQFLQYPLEGEMLIQKTKFSVFRKNNKQLICQYEINEQFPQIDFIRKSYSSILFNCSEVQSMRIAFLNNFDRDLFTLIIRSIPRRKFALVQKKIEEHKKQQKSQEKGLQSQTAYNQSQVKQLQKQKQKEKQRQRQRVSQNTMLILKIDDLNKQIKNLKRKNQQMTANFNSQRNAKTQAEKDLQFSVKQLSQLKNEHSQCESLEAKLKSLSEQNKFYFSQISLVKNQTKQKIKQIKILKSKIKQIEQQLKQKNSQIASLTEKPKQNITDFESNISSLKQKNEYLLVQIQSIKDQFITLQDQNNLLRKKVSSIASEKHIQSPTKNMGSSDSLGVQKTNKKVKDLQMKISNLQMLLKYKSGQKGNQALGLHQLVNSLTESISQKEEEILSLKKINKELLKKIQ